jgi:ABC-type Zn uptake system ZnuABC Zn-binding protein ZnuA
MLQTIHPDPKKGLTAPSLFLCILCGAISSSIFIGRGPAVHSAYAQEQAEPLKVVATLPDLGNLAREIGGDQVSVTVMAKGQEDAHFVEAKPSFIKQLSVADLYVQNGLDLEAGYAPLLLQNARNAAVLPGNKGYVDASRAITPLEVPGAPVDRSMGDVHPYGNPHHLLDPLNGLKVAALIRDTLAELRPAKRAYFDDRYAAFKHTLDADLVGETLAKKYDALKLALLFEHGTLGAFLQEQGDVAQLGGWLGLLSPLHGAKVADDHNMWPYFAHRFGIDVVGHLEPKPGIPPTTSHLGQLIEQMRAARVRAILAAPYYDPRHARFVAEATGATIVYLSHMVGGREGADDYLKMIDYNVRTLAAALQGAP